MKLLVLDRPDTLMASATEGHEQSLAAVADELARLNVAGFTLVVASNEPGLSDGQLDLDELEARHNRLSERVENRGGAIAGYFYCPHTDADQCHCRKPKTGLIDAIELEFSTPANDMILITDQPEDLRLADATGATALLVLTDTGKSVATTPAATNVQTFADFASVSDFLLRHY